MQIESEQGSGTTQVTTLVRENREDQVESFMRLEPDSLFLPEDIDKEMEWKAGTASSCMSKMYAKGKLHRVPGYKGLSGRNCLAYRIWKTGDPDPDMKSVRRINNDEVFEILKEFLEQQDPEEYFPAEVFTELDPRLSAVHSHLTPLTNKGLMERTKVNKGKNGNLVYGYRLAVLKQELEVHEELVVQENPPVLVEEMPGGQLDLKLETPHVAQKQEEFSSQEAESEMVETSFSKEYLLRGIFKLFNVKNLESFWAALHSDERLNIIHSQLQLDVKNRTLELQEAQRRVDYSRKLLETLEKTTRLLELQRLIDEQKKLAAGFDDGDLFAAFQKALPAIPIS